METFINNHISKNAYKIVSGYSKTKFIVLKSLDYLKILLKKLKNFKMYN